MTDFLELLIVALLANAIELPVIFYFSRPQRLLKRLADPNKEDLESLALFFNHAWIFFNAPSIEVIKKKNGEEEKVMISPLDNLVLRAGDSIMNRIRGVQGSMEQNLPNVLGLPRKGQSTQEYIFEQLAQRLMPTIESKINSILDNSNTQNKDTDARF